MADDLCHSELWDKQTAAQTDENPLTVALLPRQSFTQSGRESCIFLAKWCTETVPHLGHITSDMWWNPVCTKVKQNQVGKARQETYRHHAAVTSWSKTKRKHNIRNKPILHKEYRFHICVHTANTTLVMALTCHVLPVLLHTASRSSETEWYMMTHAM